MEVAALAELTYVMNRYLYPLDMVRDIFTTIEPPAAKLDRIRELDRPLQGFDYRRLLDSIWEQQNGLTDGQAVPYMVIFYREYKRQNLTEEELAQKLNALYVLAYPHILLDLSAKEVALRQSPEKVAERIQRSLDPANNR